MWGPPGGLKRGAISEMVERPDAAWILHRILVNGPEWVAFTFGSGEMSAQ